MPRSISQNGLLVDENVVPFKNTTESRSSVASRGYLISVSQAVADKRASLDQARTRAEGARKARRVVALFAMLAVFALGVVVATQWKAFRGDEESGFLLNDLRIDTRWETFGERRR